MKGAGWVQDPQGGSSRGLGWAALLGAALLAIILAEPNDSPISAEDWFYVLLGLLVVLGFLLLVAIAVVVALCRMARGEPDANGDPEKDAGLPWPPAATTSLPSPKTPNPTNDHETQ